MSLKAVLVGDSAQGLADTLRHAGYGIVRTHLAAAGELSPAADDVWLLAGTEAKLLLDKKTRPKPGFATPDPIAVDPSSLRLLELVDKVAATEVSVLLSGESGAGKEILARYIHGRSGRVAGPFCAINCAAIPESILEAELFGHEKGAFTGATTMRAGKFEQADGGTLLLDEITEMPILLQAKLLRVLQEREFERLGSGKTRSIDVRVIATTNREPREAVKDQCLREDLYYRLNVFPLRAPALRERPADIPELARFFIEKHSGPDVKVSISESALEDLSTHYWPGNVRELENVIQRAIVVAGNETIGSNHLLLESHIPTGGSSASESQSSLRDSLRLSECGVIGAALRENGQNRVATARALGISERTLRHKLQKLREQGLDVLEVAEGE